MKTVFLLRHGKAKQGPEYETDFERPLAKRGKQDAARVGEFLAREGLVPDLVVSSSAERARDTATRCTEAAGYVGELRFERSLYAAGEDAYLELLESLDGGVRSVLLVGHNPDIEIVIETLTGRWVHMSTAALARIDLAIEAWSELAEGGGRLVWVRE